MWTNIVNAIGRYRVKNATIWVDDFASILYNMPQNNKTAGFHQEIFKFFQN